MCNLLNMARDMKRFILLGKTGIEETPLQIYSSSLIFRPETSLIKTHFSGKVPAWIKQCSGVEKFWSPLLQTIENSGDQELHDQAIFSPDGSLLASFSAYEDAIRLWDTETGMLRRKLENHQARTSCVAFSPNGQWIAVTPFHSGVHVWSLKDESKHVALESGGGIVDLAFSRSGDFLTSGSAKNAIRVWDMRDFPRLLFRVLEGHDDRVTFVVFAPNDDNKLTSASEDGTIRIWDIENEKQVALVEEPGLRNMVDLRWNTRCTQLQHLTRVVSSYTIQLWDTIGKKLLLSIEPNCFLFTFDISPTGHCIAAISHDNAHNVEVWDTATGKRVCLLPRPFWRGNCGITSPRMVVGLLQVPMGS